MIARLFVLAAIGQEATGLAPTDLAAYHRALTGPIADSVVSIRFRDLWDQPEASRGRPVRIEGRVVRRFRQAGVGRFPPLSELWAVDGDGNPFCLTFPTPALDPGSTGIGRSIAFSGTYLRMIRYAGGDGARLAPLIAGPAPPTAIEGRDPTSDPSSSRPSVADWTIGAIVAGLVVLILLGRHARRPARPHRPTLDAVPLFLDGSEAE